MNTSDFTFKPEPVSRRITEEFQLPQRMGLIDLVDIGRATLRLTLSGAAAIVFFVIVTWLALTPGLAQFVSAGLWAAGFGFFALAIEPDVRRTYPMALTGFALPALSLLGQHVFEGFTIVALALVAAWLALWIGRGD